LGGCGNQTKKRYISSLRQWLQNKEHDGAAGIAAAIGFSSGGYSNSGYGRLNSYRRARESGRSWCRRC
jgi:hypothetical protein